MEQSNVHHFGIFLMNSLMSLSDSNSLILNTSLQGAKDQFSSKNTSPQL